MTEKPGIYAIRLRLDGRVYVGSASNISKRWSRHRKDLRDGKHPNKHLQAAWGKYGEGAFDWQVLELTTSLTEREQYWIDHLEATSDEKGFNHCPTARSSRGRVLSPEQRERQRQIVLAASAARTPESFVRTVAARRANRSLGQRLTWEDACNIRAEYGPPAPHGKGRRHRQNGGVTLAFLAKKYGVGTVTIYDIIKGKTWKEPPP